MPTIDDENHLNELLEYEEYKETNENRFYDDLGYQSRSRKIWLRELMIVTGIITAKVCLWYLYRISDSRNTY